MTPSRDRPPAAPTRSLIILACALVGAGCLEPPETEVEESAVFVPTCLPQDEFVRFPACANPAQCSWARFEPPPGANVAVALEAALAGAAASIGTANPQPVVYVPPGTYYLTRTVRLIDAVGVTLVGDDPGTTAFVWRGPAGGQMFVFDGVNSIKMMRLSLIGRDGNGPQAGVGIQQVRTRCPKRMANCPHAGVDSLSTSTNEYSDLTFTGVDRGFMAGDYYYPFLDAIEAEQVFIPPYPAQPSVRDSQQNNDMTLLRRNTFAGNQVGVIITGGNALGWDLWDNVFRGGATGVILSGSSGNLWRNGFERSSTADVVLKGAQFSDLRENQSSGSRAFVQATSIARLSLIDNTIVSAAVQWTSRPPIWTAATELLMLRNRVDTPPGIPAVSNQAPNATSRMTLIHGDNTYNGPAAQFLAAAPPGYSQLRRLNLFGDVYDTETAAPTIATPVPPPISTRPVATFTPAMCAAAIATDGPGACAAAIDDLLAAVPARTALHLPAGFYTIDGTVHLPGGKDLLVAGDGNATHIVPIRQPGVAAGQPVFEIMASARATVRDLRIGYNSNDQGQHYRAVGVRVHAIGDQPGLVYADTPLISATTTGFAIGAGRYGGLDQLALRIDHPSMYAVDQAILASGGGAAAAGSALTRGTRIYGGVLAPFVNALELSNWAKVVIEGTDFEVGTQAARFDAPAWATISGGRYVTTNLNQYNADNGTAFTGQQNFAGTTNFDGGFTFAQAATTSGMLFAGAPGKVLVLASHYNPRQHGGPAVYGPDVIDPPYLAALPPPPAPVPCTHTDLPGAHQQDTHSTSDVVTDGAVPWTASSSPPGAHCDDPVFFDAAFTRSMLADLSNASTPWATCGPTDVRLHRVVMQGLYGANVGGVQVQRPHVTAVEIVRDP